MLNIRFKPKIIEMNKNNANKALKLVYDLITKKNVWIGICYGTLLGAERNKDFINGDGDIDLITYKEDFVKISNILIKNKKIKMIYQNSNIMKLNCYKIKVDIYFLEQNTIDKLLNRYTWKNNWRKCYINSIYLIKGNKIQLRNNHYNTLMFHKEWLEKTYGKNYLTPQQKKGNTWTLTTKIYFILTKYRKHKTRIFVKNLRLILKRNKFLYKIYKVIN